MANHQRDPGKERFWRRLLQRWQRSGLTIRAFCAQHRLAEALFYAWRRTIAERDQHTNHPTATSPSLPPVPSTTSQPRFIPVHVLPPTAPAIELVLANGHVLRLPSGFDPDTLRQLLAVLE